MLLLTQNNQMNATDKQLNCIVQCECSTDSSKNAIHNTDQLAAVAT